MKGSDAFLQTLQAAGVEYIFGNPGTTEIALLDALDKYPQIKFILGLHESVVVAMADGYARAGGSPGIVSVHTTPGTANSLGMVINAFADYSPLVITAALKDSRSLGGGVFCDAPFNAGDMLRQYTRWAWQCLEPDNISRDVSMALHHALTAPRGPVFLAIPENFWEEDVRAGLQQLSTVSTIQTAASGEDIAKAVKLLNEAQRPVIIFGNEAGRDKITDQVVQLAERYGIPVFAEEPIEWAYFCFSNDHPLYGGPFDPHCEVVKGADLVIGIGSKMFMPRGYTDFSYLSPGTKIVHLHPDMRQIGSLYPAAAGLAGSVKKNLEALLEACREQQPVTPDEKWSALFRQHRENRQMQQAERINKDLPGEREPDVFRLVSQLSELASHDAIIVNEGIRSGFVLQEYFAFSPSRSYYGYTGGCLGWGVPAALGMKIARPQRQVIAFVGDGSFLFSCQALWTAAHYGIDVKVVLCNNRGYMAVKSIQKRYGQSHDERSGIIGEINDPPVDFVSLAQSFGVSASRVATSAELASRLAEALHTPGPFLLEVRLFAGDE